MCQLLHNLLAWRSQHWSGIVAEMKQAIVASGMVADDVTMGSCYAAGNWAGARAFVPDHSDVSVLLERGVSGWEVVNAAANLSRQEWLDLGAPQGLVGFLAREGDLSGIMWKVKNSLGLPAGSRVRVLPVPSALDRGDHLQSRSG